MNIRKSDVFLADVGRQFEWYVEMRIGMWPKDISPLSNLPVASLGQYPELGPAARFNHPRLHAWRFFVLAKPFKKHVIFYETDETGLACAE